MGKFGPPPSDLSILDELRVVDPVIRKVMIDMMAVSHLLNCMPTAFKLDPGGYQDTLISVLYRLVHSYHMADNGSWNCAQHICHLALTAWMTTLFFPSRRCSQQMYALLAQRLRHSIDQALQSGLANGIVTFWALLVGGFAVFDANQDAWLLPNIRCSSYLLNIRNWAEARQRLIHLPWIDSVHSKTGQEIWESAMYETE